LIRKAGKACKGLSESGCVHKSLTDIEVTIIPMSMTIKCGKLKLIDLDSLADPAHGIYADSESPKKELEIAEKPPT
jgi:hypothetical protein